jgi:hypothetical protein
MNPEEFATCWVPVPLRWRHVVAGDVIVGKGETPWMVRAQDMPCAGIALEHGAQHWEGDVDPDEVVQVLTPWPMAQAMALTRAELGARVIERRNANGAAA